MAEITTLSVRHHSRGDPRALTCWTIQEEPSNRISWTPHASARPKRLRKTECRELLNPTNSLPSIHIHGCACRCTQTQTDNQVQDALLAAKISSLSKTLLSSQSIKPPPPPPASSRPPLPTTRHKTKRSLASPRPGTGTSTANGITSILSTLTRLFSPSSSPSSPTPPPPSAPSLSLQADLCIGAANLDIDKVARYLVLAGGGDPPLQPPLPVNAPNHLGMTPLMAAVRSPAARVRPKAHLEMVRFLVDCCGADVDATRVDRVTGAGESVLSMACGMGAAEVVRFLVGRGAMVDARLPAGAGIGKAARGVAGRGQTALHVAVLADWAECVEVLVEEGKADVRAVFDAAGNDRAVGEGGLKGLKRRPGSVSRDGRDKKPRHPVSALHLAHGSVSCTQVLLEGDADVGARDGYGRTPLHWAAAGGHADVARVLISAGADVSVSSDDGTTPLGSVVASLEKGDEKPGHAEVVRMLLQADAEGGFGHEGLKTLKETWLVTEEAADTDSERKS